PPITTKPHGASAASWYGISVQPTATAATLGYANVKHAVYGAISNAPGAVFSASNTTFDTSTYGVHIGAGNPTLSTITASNNSYGVSVGGACSPTLTDCIVKSNSSYGFYL